MPVDKKTEKIIDSGFGTDDMDYKYPIIGLQNIKR